MGERMWIGVLLATTVSVIAGCVGYPVHGPSSAEFKAARLTPATSTYQDLLELPPPKGKIVVAVYGFRDQTGQYKAAPDSSFSTAVTQGAAAILVKVLKESGWFVPVEREGLQNLLTERRVIRAAESQKDAQPQLPQLLPSGILIEGGIVSYETNIKTGGAGARYLGVGLSGQYRTDQVTVNLRAVDVRTGRVLNSVSTTKAVFSHQLDLNVFQFVAFDKLLEAEVGYTRNEPAQMCVTDAIQVAVIHLIVQGVLDNSWALKDSEDVNSPIFKAYIDQQQSLDGKLPGGATKGN